MNTLEFEISKQYKQLRASEKKVADYLLVYKGEVNDLTIIGLSEGAKASQPTIIRFCKAIGLEGFKELKRRMIQEELKKQMVIQEPRPLYGFNIGESDELADIPSKVIATTVKVMQDTLKSISTKSYSKTIEAITGARNVMVFGVENSRSTVADLVTKLLYLGINCISYDDYYLQSICASNLTSEDVAIGISYSGCSKNTVDVMRAARKAGATTIAITNFEKATINKYADLVISATSEQYMYGDAIFSRTSQLAIVDMIYSGVLVSDYQRYTHKMDVSSKVICKRAYQMDSKKR